MKHIILAVLISIIIILIFGCSPKKNCLSSCKCQTKIKACCCDNVCKLQCDCKICDCLKK